MRRAPEATVGGTRLPSQEAGPHESQQRDPTAVLMQEPDVPPVPNPPVREPTLSEGFAKPRLADFRPAASDSRHVVHELLAS